MCKYSFKTILHQVAPVPFDNTFEKKLLQQWNACYAVKNTNTLEDCLVSTHERDFMQTDGQIRLLLVDDDTTTLQFIEAQISEDLSPQYNVTHVRNLHSALAELKSADFDIVLVDLSLPDAYGPDVVLPIRETAPRVPVVVITGLDNEEIAIRVVRDGVQDYLIKGLLDATSLNRSIRYAIERQRMMHQLEKARELEQFLAYHDALTGLPNRKMLIDRLHQAISRARRSQNLVGLLSLDLDGFKHTNDTLGYGAGDTVLKTVAERLRKTIRESDTVARVSGDEFMLIIDNLHRDQDAVIVCEKILRTLAEPYQIHESRFYMTASIGVSIYPFDGNDEETLIKNADIAMYRAKSEQRNSYQLYNLSMAAQIQERIHIEKELRRILAEENPAELTLHYQPLLNMQTGHISTLEALVRWQHPEIGFISPTQFIPIAEETGLIDPLGQWIIRQACTHNKLLQDNGFNPVRVAINLSTKQFRQRDIREIILSALDSSGLDPQHLALEITESSAMEDVEYTIQLLNYFRKLGVRISVDDFGTGYSSLSYLKKLPADVLKIDRSFIDGVPNDRNDTSITAAIISLAHNLELGVVAEGVENQQQYAYLQSLHCDEMQGYHFSRPLSFEELCQILP
jgi:diguanylate cyclase (GGDEF)-like protein